VAAAQHEEREVSSNRPGGVACKPSTDM
jgi:hypothetical protein